MRGSPQTIHRRASARAALLLALTGACSGNGGAPILPPLTDLVLAPIPETVRVMPGERAILHFALTSQGVGVAGQRLTFGIVDDPDAGSKPQGATLATDNALTDAEGVAQIAVNAGQVALFRVRASTANQTVETEGVVLVTPGDVGDVQIAPFFLPGTPAAAGVTVIDVAFFDSTRCASIPFSRLPNPGRAIRSVPASDGIAQFDTVAIALNHAVVGRARDGRGVVQAQGCIDLPGTTLVAGDLVRVALPLAEASPSPVGAFDVTSQFSFANPPAASAAIAAPWLDLQDCPLDPAQLWLDCTIDALSGSSAEDPGDCQPVDGAEGELGAALAARRGTPLTAAGGQASACRGSQDALGAASHDALLAGSFGAPKPSGLVSLHAIAQDAGSVLSSLTIKSRLVVAATPSPDVFEATHTFTSVVLSIGRTASTEVVLAPLALPALVAPYIHATTVSRALLLDQHRVTLRLGAVARIAFGRLALATRGLPASSPAALNALLRLAAVPLPPDLAQATQTVTANGCEALDRLLCTDLGRAVGCLLKACNDGVAALAARLDAGFDAASGDGLDLVIQSGRAPLIDLHRSGVADRLGDVSTFPPAPASWSATLRTPAGNEQLTAQWEALRAGN